MRSTSCTGIEVLRNMESRQFLRPTLSLYMKGKDNGEFFEMAARTRFIADGLRACSKNSLLAISCYHAIAVQHRIVGKI